MVEQQAAVATPPGRGASLVRLVGDYIALTKPPIISLLVITAIGGMFVAAQGAPSALMMLLVCVGGSLGAGGANALNHFMDQDIDSMMSRTRQRPVPGHRISPGSALAFGIILNVLAFGLLAAWVNILAASLYHGRQSFLRAGLHRMAEADHPTQHRHWGSRRGHPADGGMGSRHRRVGLAGVVHVHHCFLLDAAPFLGVGPLDRDRL